MLAEVNDLGYNTEMKDNLTSFFLTKLLKFSSTKRVKNNNLPLDFQPILAVLFILKNKPFMKIP